MLYCLLCRLFFLLIWTPKKYRTCEYGWHEYSKWQDSYGYQERYCKICHKSNARLKRGNL